ncbi:MAG TPA: AsmA-like C-terminal region-containing protein [Chitinophagales bacterium]|nr:AsmA-like C-terminal region-containing protein [Chitinophagales bacterium]
MAKKILISVAVIFILLTGFLIASPFLFKGKLVALAKSELNKQLNAKVDFKDGGITLFRDFPRLTFSLEELNVVNNAPFEGDTLASIRSFSTSINIMSLIKGGAIDIRGIRISEPKINVRVLKDGSANYDIIKETQQPEKKDTAEAKYKVKLKEFKISDGVIRYDDRQSDMSALISGLDFSGSGDFTQDVFDFKTLTTIRKVIVNSGGINYLNNASLDLKLDLGIDLPDSTYTFKENTLRVNALALGVDGWLSDKTPDQYDMDLKFSAKETSFKNLLSLVPAIYLKDFEKVKTSGSIALSGFAKGTYKGDNYPAFGISVKVDDAMFQYPDLPAAVTGITIDMKAGNPGGNLDKTVIDVPKFNLKIGDETGALRLHVQTPVSDPDIDMQVKGKLNLANVKQFYPLGEGEEITGIVDADAAMKGKLSALENEQYQKVQASGTVNVSGLHYRSKDYPAGIAAGKIAIVFSSKTSGSASDAALVLPVKGYGTLDIQNLKYPDKTLPGGIADISSLQLTLNEKDARLERLNVAIGKSDFAFKGKLDNLLGYLLSDGTLSGNLDIRSNYIDLNEWMTTESVPDTAAEPPANTETESSAVPANLALDIAASAAKVLYDKVEMKNVLAKASIRDEIFTLHSLTAEMLGGTTSLNGSYSTREAPPKVNFSYDIRNINIAQAVNSMSTAGKLAPVFRYMNGKFSAKGDMKGSLLSDLSLDLKSLLANGRVDISNASVSGLPVLNNLADKFKIAELKNMSISDAWTVFKVKNGRIDVEPFDIKFKNIVMNISGSQGLDQTVDYTIIMDIPNGLLGGANELIKELLVKNPIPGFNAANLPELTRFKIKVTNTLQEPKMDVALTGAGGATIKEQITESVKEQVNKAKEEALAKAREEADKLIADARLQAQKIRDEARKLADNVKKEGYAAAKKLEDEAKNPIAKIAAQEAAKKLRKETDDKANKIIKEADDKANKLEQEAQRKAQHILQRAQ